jgi:hypothetical protein
VVTGFKTVVKNWFARLHIAIVCIGIDQKLQKSKKRTKILKNRTGLQSADETNKKVNKKRLVQKKI